MNELNTQKVAMTFGALFGGLHLVWSVLVLVGLAQPLMDFAFWAHMVEASHRVTGFTLAQSLTLVVVTSIVGYVFGWVFASIWNKMHK